MSSRIKIVVPFAVALFLVAVLAIGAVVPDRAAAQTQTANGLARTITVVGRGEVKSKPDVARTNLGVEVTAPTVAEAVADAEARMNAILAALKGAGIPAKDIQTSNYSINFERQSPEPQASETGTIPGVYRVSNMVQVTIRDLDAVGEIIDVAVKAGANNVWGVSFGLEDTDALEDMAREDAINDANARAESLAELTGVEVGEVLTVSEVVGSQPYPMFAAAEGRGGGGGPVEPGELTFSTQIQVVYGIE